MQREVQSGVAAFLKDYPKRDEIVNARGEIRLEVIIRAYGCLTRCPSSPPPRVLDLPPELIAEIEGIQGRCVVQKSSVETQCTPTRARGEDGRIQGSPPTSSRPRDSCRLAL
eukprot:scaffold275861_cov27-Tisochrysis_lutea.AAC.3